MQKYNKEKVVKSEIVPLMEALLKVCNEQQVPIFISVASKNSEEGTSYELISLSPDVLGVSLADNKFSKFVNVMNGFETVPPRTILELDY